MTALQENRMPPRGSLSLPVYNGEPFLEQAIRSILEQDFTDFERVITDNASSDRRVALEAIGAVSPSARQHLRSFGLRLLSVLDAARNQRTVIPTSEMDSKQRG